MRTRDSQHEHDLQKLPGLLSEFRSALLDEIEVAKRNASHNAIPLTNGHKVGQLGGGHQYAFLLESVLNAPDGAPGDLVVPGKSPLSVTIVAVEGLRLLLSVESDLGPFVPTARIQTNLAMLMRKLVERIETRACEENPAAQRMLGLMPVVGRPVIVSNHEKLTLEQKRALESSLGRDLTVIWGPPGTGKTYTIGTIVERLWELGRSVLVVSHTNTAVDQAIKHVAKSLRTELTKGAVVRVGEVRDDQLKSDYPEVLLKRQVEIQSRELVEQRQELTAKIETLNSEVERVQDQLDLFDWIPKATAKVREIEKLVVELDNLERVHSEELRSLNELRSQHKTMLDLHNRISQLLGSRKALDSKREEQARLSSEVAELGTRVSAAQRKLKDQQDRLEIANRIADLRSQLAALPTHLEQVSSVRSLSSKHVEVETQHNNLRTQWADATALLEQVRNTIGFMRAVRGLPSPETQAEKVKDLVVKMASLGAEKEALREALHAATTKLSRVLELEAQVSQYKNIGTRLQESLNVQAAKSTFDQVNGDRIRKESQTADSLSELRKLEVDVTQQSAGLPENVKDVYVDVCSRLQRLKELPDVISDRGRKLADTRQTIRTEVSRLRIDAQRWSKRDTVPTSEPDQLQDLAARIAELALRATGAEVTGLLKQLGSLRADLKSRQVSLAEIDRKLSHVERGIIMGAAVLGATLTKAYLSDDIQARKFDTVVLDEASMAPIPALWVAALLSQNNLIIVGDFKQLPPIVLSQQETTIKWLGRDIFEASGLKEMWEKRNMPDYFVPLQEQRRMVPEIADIANFFYDNILRNAKDYPKGLKQFESWYQKNWPHDNPVLLVDTGSLNAWVTSVVKGGNTSRLNFLSATVAVDLAEQLLRPDRVARSDGAPKRILIVAPYRAHARLVSVLVSENLALRGEVIAGTAHSFQGSEADVVIFDLVVDEPHFRVNMFTPSIDEDMKRLLNVALTRAKFRLVIMGDFSYCQSQGRNAFLGKSLVPFLLKRFPRVSASDIVPLGLAARAAQAQMTMLGGSIEPDSERVVVTQAAFFRILSTDISSAKSRVVIYSPFMTTDRVSFLLPQLQAAAARGASVFIVTKPYVERSKSELGVVREIEAQLTSVGCVVIHKMGMHEKLVFVDSEIVWSGSLNPLSYSNTQEIMERRKSRRVLEDYAQMLRLQELVEVPGTHKSHCPICGSEMIAAEGAEQPYYWRCINDDCYTRSIDQAYPLGGLLPCRTCGGPVEFGYWGDEPHWRCQGNNRHRSKISKSHLRLPKMAALIPPSEMKKVRRVLGIDEQPHRTKPSRRTPHSAQLRLFDEPS